jgi:hypothetical protein
MTEYGTGDREHRDFSKEISEVGEIILAAWHAARTQLGAVNNHRTAELLYQSMFHPETLTEDEVPNTEGFDRLAVLRRKRPLFDLPAEQIPSEEEFISTLRHALTSEPRYELCLHDGAKEVLTTLAKYGPVRIWTTGDVYGITGTSYQGSKEQFKRMAGAGIGELRKEIAAQTERRPHDVISVTATEHKFNELPKIYQEYAERGITNIVLLEDRIVNIQQALKLAEEIPGVKVFPVWVRQGNAANIIPAGIIESEAVEKFHAVNSIKEVPERLGGAKMLDLSSLGFIVDYDDVISDDKKRRAEQTRVVFEKLKTKGWIKI